METSELATRLEALAMELTRLAAELRETPATRYDGPGGGPINRDPACHRSAESAYLESST
jgi:hypothetical protein